MSIKRIILLFLTLALPLSACSRAPQLPNTEKLIIAMCQAEIGLPAGEIYSTDVDGSSPRFLTDRLLASYFGDPNIEKHSAAWLSCSIFLSSSDHPCEFAVILCQTPESLTDTARLLASRLDSIKRNANEKFSSYTEQAAVITYKNYAILIVSGNTDAAVKAMRKAAR